MDIFVINKEKVKNMENKLCLGTVQFGLKYGVNNAIGRKPNKQEVFNLIKCAIDSGIDTFDTASVYGNAEKLLGDFGIGKYQVSVISKLKPNITGCDVVKEVKTSLQNIKVEQLYGYLLHDAKDFYKDDIVEGLLKCRKAGLIKNIGVSIYEPDDAINIVDSGIIDYIQIPYNVFDQRLNETSFFSLANQFKVKVFARSAFLQGLLIMDLNNIPPNLLIAKSYIQKFDDIVKAYGFSRNEAAFLFSYCNPHIDKVVFGVDTIEQLEININIMKRIDEFSDCYKELLGNFKGIERKIIIPSLW